MSWKTTLFGAVGAVGVYFASLTGVLHALGILLQGIGTYGIGHYARDNDKSSEDVGVKK